MYCNMPAGLSSTSSIGWTLSRQYNDAKRMGRDTRQEYSGRADARYDRRRCSSPIRAPWVCLHTCSTALSSRHRKKYETELEVKLAGSRPSDFVEPPKVVSFPTLLADLESFPHPRVLHLAYSAIAPGLRWPRRPHRLRRHAFTSTVSMQPAEATECSHIEKRRPFASPPSFVKTL